MIRFTEQELDAIQKRIKAGANVKTRRLLDEVAKPPTKYRNSVVRNVEGKFDSKREYAHWLTLRGMLQTGEISDLERQVRFELAPAAEIEGRTKPALRYFADFTFQRRGKTVVQDVKGIITDAFVIKRHLMKTVHGLDIEIIK